MNALIFDTETTNLNGFVIEGAFFLVDLQTGRLRYAMAGAYNPLAPVFSEVVKKFSIAVDELKRFPPFRVSLKSLSFLFEKADVIIAHNVSFDLKILRNELSRIGIDLKDWIMPELYSLYNCVCTMDFVRKFFRLSKNPRLSELPGVLKVDEGKVSAKVGEIYEALKKRLKYDPSVIRTGKVLFHNALYDTCFLSVMVRELYKKHCDFREYLSKQALKSKVEIPVARRVGSLERR